MYDAEPHPHLVPFNESFRIAAAPTAPPDDRSEKAWKERLEKATKDLDDALNNIFQHPNVGPFLAKRLIKSLVTSNPSPAYVARIAQVFNNSAGVRGDLRAVIRAILLDPEARAGDPPNTPSPGFGHLR